MIKTEAMQIISDMALLGSIERFLARSGIKPSTFGREAMGDPSLVAQLRAGRSLSLKNARKLARFMELRAEGCGSENGDGAAPCTRPVCLCAEIPARAARPGCPVQTVGD